MPIASTWNLPHGELDLTQGALVGVLNLTPDSFSDGGRYQTLQAAVGHTEAMVQEGASIIDVGGESTRPGAEPVEVTEELARVSPVVRELAGWGVPISIDTYKAEVASRAIEEGASIVNDIDGFADPAMAEVAVGSHCGIVVMHGRDATLDPEAVGDDLVGHVEHHLLKRTEQLVGSGVDPSRIVIDPGLGFAKRPQQSISLLAGITRLASNGFPVMVGASRKGFLGSVDAVASLEDRDNLTAAVTALAFALGARLFRVHDVGRSRGALRMADAIVASQSWDEWLQG